MYYNSYKNSNDYYNSYKKELAELEAYRKEERTQKIMKIILSILTLILLIAATFYLYKYFNPSLHKVNISTTDKVLSTSKPIINIAIREEELPKSIQLRESNMQTIKSIQKNQVPKLEVNEKDIELIVKIIMAQMNAKVEKTLEEQLNEVNNKVFVNKSLKNNNHYNKVIVTNNRINQSQNDSLLQLSNSLNTIINEKTNLQSNYTQIIQRESSIHENEMCVIIVENGDTLSKIAKKAYGNRDDYQKILTANPEIIKNPNQIFVGQRLRIPS